jgi:hypothetical protein
LSAAADDLAIKIKWILMGHYRPGEHPLYSWPLYLRMQGATVGRDVWFELLTVTEFDVADLGDGCVVNRNGVVETHLFHDRLMRPLQAGRRRNPRPGRGHAAGHHRRRELQHRPPVPGDARRTPARRVPLARRSSGGGLVLG